MREWWTSRSVALLVIVVLAGATVFSQFALCDNFLETLGGTGEIWSLMQKADGSIAAAGWNNSTFQSWVGKFTAAGTISMQRTFWPVSGIFTQSLESAMPTADGGYLLSFDLGSYYGDNAVWLVKVKSNGTMEWHRTFGDSTNWYYSGTAVRTSDGGCALLTKVRDSSYVWWTYLIKLDSSGADQWVKKYATSFDGPAQIAQTSLDGGFVVVLDVGYNALIWRLKADGTFLWQFQPSGSLWNDVYLAAIRETSEDHEFILVGWVQRYLSDKDVLIIMLKSDGSVEWSDSYDVDGHNDWAADVVQTADGGYAVVGTVRENDAFFMKIDSTGGIIWQKQYMDLTNLYAAARRSDGGYLLGGVSKNSSFPGAMLVSTDSSGEVGSGCSSYGPCHLTGSSELLGGFATSYTVESATASASSVGYDSADPLWESNFRLGHMSGSYE